MKILLTGASSFTGYWFAKKLVEAGHTITAPLRGSTDDENSTPRAKRVKNLSKISEIIPACSFGSDKFIDLINSEDFDVLCHHAAEVKDYKSPEFDINAAVSSNTKNARDVLRLMTNRGLKSCVLTGSVFENDEGCGNLPLKAFSAYGVSKAITALIFRFYCDELQIKHGKFVIPNPFGPLEEPRLGAYLAKTWKANNVAEINTPDYTRDNIHVDLLADVYVNFIQNSTTFSTYEKINPSGYVESQGSFVMRLSREISKRTGRECRVSLLKQKDFNEPIMRVNNKAASQLVQGWNESASWDAYATEYI